MKNTAEYVLALLPLKGYWMKQMYPQPYLRQMAAPVGDGCVCIFVRV